MQEKELQGLLALQNAEPSSSTISSRTEGIKEAGPKEKAETSMGKAGEKTQKPANRSKKGVLPDAAGLQKACRKIVRGHRGNLAR